MSGKDEITVSVEDRERSEQGVNSVSKKLYERRPVAAYEERQYAKEIVESWIEAIRVNSMDTYWRRMPILKKNSVADALYCQLLF
ncbi:hypothetical protein [Natrinema sp. 74]|uniref:hypothetical protein n=1 Tax=Natrinema sp. 74 TaxID=3384159 RepID=UPI0038D49B5C